MTDCVQIRFFQMLVALDLYFIKALKRWGTVPHQTSRRVKATQPMAMNTA